MKPALKETIAKMASIADLVQEARMADTSGLTLGRPEGGITIAEYSRECGVSISAARRALEGLVMQGKYEVKPAIDRIPYGTRVTRLKFYRKVKR